jgi:DNA-binding transcriptional LysR family regulator
MTLEQLRIFVEVATRQHVTAAAKALNLTQSAASAAVAALEQRHDVKLFHRVGRGIVLTEAGQMFLGEARGVLARAAAAERALAELGDLRRGTLRLVASQTTAAYWLPPFLARYRQIYPGIAVELAIANTAQAAASIREGLADLGVVEGVVDDPALAQWPLGEDRLVVVGGTPHGGEVVDAPWLRAAHWVHREAGSGTRSSLDAVLLRHGVDPAALEVVLELPSNESVRSAVEAGAGIAALSALVVAPSIAAGKLHAVPFDLGVRAFYGLRHKECYRGKAADALLDFIQGAEKSGHR